MAMEQGWKSELRAAEVLRGLELQSLPIDPFEIAQRKDILCQENRSLGSGVSGCMMKVGDNFGILYSTRFASEGFQRFTVGHELGHYFMDGHVSHLFANGQSLHQSLSGFISKDPYEAEADAFAASLLMPKGLFAAAIQGAGEGLKAIETLAALCRTSLTATAIRVAKLTTEPLAVVCTTGHTVNFAVMSETLRQYRDLTWLKRGAGVPAASITAIFNADEANIRLVRRMSGETTLADWFHSDIAHEMQEEVCGLGEYGRTLTVLWCDSLPDSPDPFTEDQEPRTDEDLMPSQRFYQKSRY
jgi:Zn-dependent peptidase ImmA (M78 family)